MYRCDVSAVAIVCLLLLALCLRYVFGSLEPSSSHSAAGGSTPDAVNAQLPPERTSQPLDRVTIPASLSSSHNELQPGQDKTQGKVRQRY